MGNMGNVVKKWMKIAGRILLLLVCMCMSASCASGQGIQEEQEAAEEQTAQDFLSEARGEDDTISDEEGGAEGWEPDAEGTKSDTEESDVPETEFSPEGQMQENEALFLEKAKEQKVGTDLAGKLFERLLDDRIFQDGNMALTGLMMDDIDGNGQTDMLVMVQDAAERPYYGSGGLWFYMNEDEPYCFEEEACSFCGWFDAFWADVDNDENIEIVFSAAGTGCGAVGDFYKAVFKYKGHAIEQMELPSDLEEDYDCGLRVELVQEPAENVYSAYCPYFDELIPFYGKNVEGWEPPDSPQIAGGNARGFYNLCVAEYEGKKMLQASEYLYGEGGTVHNVATAQFLITWEKDGTPKVVKWWIEEAEDGWVNSHESRICYEDGYYYYASQSDHYYLYRAKADGSEPQCLAKVHPGSICVQDDEIYFINQSDGNGIYRMKTDGSGMEKLYEYGSELRISAEYVFFCSTYQAAYDKKEMVTEEPSEYDSGFLYRMKRDGSEPELIAADVWKYVLGNENGQKMRYAGFLYYSKKSGGGTILYRMETDGQNAEEICCFDVGGSMMVYGNSLYYAGIFYGDRNQVSRYRFGDGETTTFEVPEYTDCCIYNGRFYGINEVMEENGHKITVYRMDYDMKSYEILYEELFTCEYAEGGYVSDLYASGDGLFFRKFISSTEGCQWFRLAEDDVTGEWRAEEWEDREKIPETLPAGNIEYGERLSVMLVLESTEGYEACLADELEYEEFYWTDEEGKGHNAYTICLPQFNSKIAGYQKINRYFQDAYEEAIKDKEDFFKLLEEEGMERTFNWNEMTGYNYIYIGENYITVAKYEGGYRGGVRDWKLEEPVTFDRKSGEQVSLEEILGMPQQEAVAQLTGSIYKYMEGIGNGKFLLKEEDVLTEKYDPEQFFLFPEGIGIYYERHAISSGAGDYMFVIPYGDAAFSGPGKMP